MLGLCCISLIEADNSQDNPFAPFIVCHPSLLQSPPTQKCTPTPLSLVSDKTFALAICPICQLAPGQVVNLRITIEMLVKYVEKWTSRVTRHIESNPTLANVAPIVQMLPPPIVQPATMSPPGNFLQLGGGSHRELAHLPLFR